jgi:hypothetical protein
MLSRTRIVLALTAVMVVVWAGVASGNNGDPILIGQNNTGTAGTTLTTTQTGSAPGLLVLLNGTSTGAAVKAQSNGPGNGISGVATDANAFGTRSFNLDSTHGTGAAGAFSGNQNDGVRGTTDNGSSYGIQGINTNASGVGSGVYGLVQAGGGPGVQGKTNGFGNGVFGQTGSGTASGVYGENNSGGGFGVAGRAGSSGNAIYGDNTGTGWAGYFEDKVHIGGPLDCAGCVGASDISGRVNDSDKLDGIDSTGFGRASGQALAEAPGAHIFLGPPMLGFIRLSYACPSTLTNNGVLRIYNDSGSIANVFVESGGANPTYYQMNNGGTQDFPASATGDSFHIQAQGAPGVLTIEAASVHRAADCHAQAQGLMATTP